MLLNKILVANRGEIACRIIRTCQDMGIATVAVYSDADKNAQHVHLADEAVYIGNSPPKQSYLSIESIIGAAIRTSADAIHPGYGFLAESSNFAYAAISEGITFIGPPPSAMEVMGNKRTTKFVLQDMPFVAGYSDNDQSDKVFVEEADNIGYPVMIKAVVGVGGKAMRKVDSPDMLKEALDSCRREAKQNFGNDNLLLEKVIDFPRQLEIQIFGDHSGNLIALGESESTIQRRYRKIVDESPSSMMTSELRKTMSEMAVKIGKQLGYYGAGTVEFLVDDDDNIYLMEVNARLQAEHPVTEMVTGFDLVRWQIEIARDVTLDELLPEGITAESYVFNPIGHAIQARVYAEDPSNDFQPSTGTIALWSTPDFVRTDTGIRTNDEITSHYDPTVAKIITQGTTRLEAIRRLDYGLSKVQLLGVENNINFLRRILTHSDHLAGIIHTGFLDEYAELMTDSIRIPAIALITATFAQHSEHNHIHLNFKYGNQTYSIKAVSQSTSPLFDVTIDDVTYEVELVSTAPQAGVIVVDGHRQKVSAIETQKDEWWIHTNDGTFVLQSVTS